MQGLMMGDQLTLTAILRRAAQVNGAQEIVSREPDRSIHRYRYADFAARARRLAVALRGLGLERGDRVATLAWNHYRHLESYFGIPAAGGVLHTLNLRLHPDELAYVASHAGDRFLIVDDSLRPLAEQFVGRTPIERVIAVDEYEALLAAADPEAFEDPLLQEDEAAAMCYTTGTTGNPKGVVYSHRSLVLHSLLTAADAAGIGGSDTILPVVPMFHANAWGLPYTATMLGSRQVFPGPFLDGESLLDLLAAERVTVTAGVPTIWFGILDALDREPGRWDLSALRGMLVGGSAAPRSMIAAFEERHGLTVWHGWGMTEMSPVGTTAAVGDVEARVKQGRPLPFVELRARGDDGLVPWDGATMGELEVRGPTIAASYYESPESADRWTDDGWFRTGDIVTISSDGTIEVQDRSKDLIKSGGEWISSVALENAAMGHPAVREAAVIGVPDERWTERPLVVCALREGRSLSLEELREHLAADFPRWCLPDHLEIVDEIPRTSAGKFRKTALRERYGGIRSSAAG